MSSPDDLERLRAVEMDARGRLHVQARLVVEDRDREGHVDTTEGIDHVGELVEVQCHRVLNRYAEVLFDRGDDLADALEESGVDFVGPSASSVGDEEVTGNGEESQAMTIRIDMQNHDDITVDAVDPLGAQPVG